MNEHRQQNTRSSDKLSSKLLSTVWPIFVASILAALAWGAMQTEIKGQGKVIEKHCEKDDKISSEHAERLARLEEAIKVLPEIRQDVKTLLGSQKEILRIVR